MAKIINQLWMDEMCENYNMHWTDVIRKLISVKYKIPMWKIGVDARATNTSSASDDVKLAKSISFFQPEYVFRIILDDRYEDVDIVVMNRNHPHGIMIMPGEAIKIKKMLDRYIGYDI